MHTPTLLDRRYSAVHYVGEPQRVQVGRPAAGCHAVAWVLIAMVGCHAFGISARPFFLLVVGLATAPLSGLVLVAMVGAR